MNPRIFLQVVLPFSFAFTLVLDNFSVDSLHSQFISSFIGLSSDSYSRSKSFNVPAYLVNSWGLAIGLLPTWGLSYLSAVSRCCRNTWRGKRRRWWSYHPSISPWEEGSESDGWVPSIRFCCPSSTALSAEGTGCDWFPWKQSGCWSDLTYSRRTCIEEANIPDTDALEEMVESAGIPFPWV